MLPKKKRYKIVGTAPIVVNGKRFYVGEEFDADPGEVGFLLEIGAVKEVKEAYGGRSSESYS